MGSQNKPHQKTISYYITTTTSNFVCED